MSEKMHPDTKRNPDLQMSIMTAEVVFQYKDHCNVHSFWYCFWSTGFIYMFGALGSHLLAIVIADITSATTVTTVLPCHY